MEKVMKMVERNRMKDEDMKEMVPLLISVLLFSACRSYDQFILPHLNILPAPIRVRRIPKAYITQFWPRMEIA
jgi:hypothetical protein